MIVFHYKKCAQLGSHIWLIGLGHIYPVQIFATNVLHVTIYNPQFHKFPFFRTCQRIQIAIYFFMYMIHVSYINIKTKKKKKKEQLTKKERHVLSACFFMARSYECCNYVISTLHNIEYIITKSWCKNVELHVQTMHARAM